MQVNVFIAKRIIFNKQPSFSGLIIRLATIATAISVATMIITLSMVNGFQHEVSKKVFDFWGHMRLQALEPMRTLVAEETPVEKTTEIESTLAANDNIAHVHAFATHSLVLRSKQQFEGVLLKGVDARFSNAPFSRFIKKGRNIHFSSSGYSSELLLSETTAKLLEANIGDTLRAMYMREGEELRTRKLVVVGIFKCGIEEYDKNFAIVDLAFLQKMNNWSANQVGGFEIWLKDTKNAGVISKNITRQLPQGLMCQPIEVIYPNIFDWLNIQNQTKRIVTGVMLAVALINLVTCLLILVMERTKMVAILSASGMRGGYIQQIFWYYAGWIAGIGIATGLILALGLLALQKFTGLIKMDESTYYVDRMPVFINWWEVVFVLLGCLLVCLAALRIPLFFVRRISIIKALRFN